MGTRADFYIGNDPKTMMWLGSIAFDGHPSGVPKKLLKAKTEQEYLDALIDIAKQDDFTSPSQGWPWPWEDSRTTDYSYAFVGDRVLVSGFGRKWTDTPDETDTEWYSDTPKESFPHMENAEGVVLGERSGLITFVVRK